MRVRIAVKVRRSGLFGRFSWVAAATASSLAIGCGSDASSGFGAPADGGGVGGGIGAGGAPTSGGAPAGGKSGSGGITGSGGSAPAPTSMFGACVGYVQAECQRRTDCGFDRSPTGCLTTIDECPDFLFSPGSTRTIQSALACAEVWKSFSCNEVALDKVPPCTSPGTRQPGQTCAFGPQCTSIVCSTSGSCGTCATLAPLSGDCSGSNVVCPDGQECGAGKCVDRTPAQLTPVTPVGAGQACLPSNTCPSGYACIRDGNSPTAPAHCSVPPSSGMPCAVGVSSDVVTCADGLYCGPGNTCTALPTAGSPCASAVPGCSKDAFCNGGATAGPTCAPRTDAGTSCTPSTSELIQSSCMTGLSCFCNGTPCTAGTCYELRKEDEACGDVRGHCMAGTACTSGRCVASDALTKFAACGP